MAISMESFVHFHGLIRLSSERIWSSRLRLCPAVVVEISFFCAIEIKHQRSTEKGEMGAAVSWMAQGLQGFGKMNPLG